MPRFARAGKRYIPYRRDKYSVEQTAGTIQTNAESNGGVTVVQPSTTQGMRKVKHITISMAQNGSGQGVYWALVYVPAGTQANMIHIDDTSMYEPNQFVMNCGIFDVDAGPMRITSPISRNLNSGDSIALILHSTTPNTVYAYVVRYAITLQ